MCALVSARYLMRAASLWKDANVDMFHIGPRHREWDKILRLARGCAGVAANAARLIDDLGPLYRPVLWFFEHESSVIGIGESELYHAKKKRKHCDEGSLV